MDPLLIDFPERIETDRLILRSARPGDGPAVNAAVLETLDDLRPYMPWAQAAPTLEASETDVRRMYGKFALRQDMPLLMFERGLDGCEGLYAGGTGLHRIDWAVPRFEIGYWCRRSRQRRGYVAEAVVALSHFAFETLGARRVEIRMDDRNEPSWRVAERAGYTLEGVLRQDSLSPSGEPRDTRVYAKVRGIEFTMAS
ncbi:MAG: GNAT family N-acetyltransferase [Proteobacteria bacterium]|nr:GNAT family N-acetyltransferase [Pseudomonadota bacterium]